MGIATQKQNLRDRFDHEKSAERLNNLFEAWTEQMTDFARMCGRRRLGDLNYDDLATTCIEIANFTPVARV